MVIKFLLILQSGGSIELKYFFNVFIKCVKTCMPIYYEQYTN